MKKILLETIHIFVPIVIGIIAFHFVFDLSNIKTESVIDINVHDTYFIVEKSEILPVFCITIIYLFYLIKVCFQKFENYLSLCILSIISLILILILPAIISFIKSLATQPGWTIYPPLSAKKVEFKENLFSRIYPKIYILYCTVTLFGFFVFYKLGKLHKRQSS